MGIKDKMFWWFVKNIIISKNELIDNPGFIILRLSDKASTINIREILLPETLFLEIENKIIKKYGDGGKRSLYSIGKNFGYNFAFIFKYPKADKEKDFSNFSYFLVRYLESIYANKVEHAIDFKEKRFVFKTKNWIVCNKNGFGFILFDGTGAGMIAYAFDDPSIEGVQTKCEGRGDDHCELVCAPEAYFKKEGIKFFSERGLKEEFNVLEYSKINQLQKSRYAANSFKSLLDSGFFKYDQGSLSYGNERFALIESSIMYFIETGLKGLKDGEKILWNVSFDFGKRLAKASAGKQDPAKFIMDFFPALGFGDILVSKKDGKYNVYVNYFPWTKWYKDVKFTIFRGMLSGVISGMEGKEVRLESFKTDLSRGYFSLSCGE